MSYRKAELNEKVKYKNEEFLPGGLLMATIGNPHSISTNSNKNFEGQCTCSYPQVSFNVYSILRYRSKK